jgi:hypothetical protein
MKIVDVLQQGESQSALPSTVCDKLIIGMASNNSSEPTNNRVICTKRSLARQ